MHEVFIAITILWWGNWGPARGNNRHEAAWLQHVSCFMSFPPNLHRFTRWDNDPRVPELLKLKRGWPCGAACGLHCTVPVGCGWFKIVLQENVLQSVSTGVQTTMPCGFRWIQKSSSCSHGDSSGGARDGGGHAWWGGGRPGSLRTSWQGGLIDNSILRKLWNGKGYKDCISYTNYPPNGNIYKTLLTFT